ncbi:MULTISPECIES: undecaprenyldiphospho-muramoylpentapeptide beta-N-acetylglucosaminyltransferase [unclassified Polaromonas]|uniref:undecaprenyldiphospho-muramoylpentapeptide beta-N-acetylglucosaminyltransferase n=1 Tax=unclassified Polaromonas TaxID=2638319 RepID=UPI0018CAD74B|nr:MULTISPECIES: undecaprenyldiphospho-muramoylpentapeptide beta-N-acetylglucosaminyltransferase [unclassified Polaromonas]MDH6186278.1 UDP-N-acetylglucosamine--N-acetylmuramyl-(pentapeptide) pyrophosphoryl-undecaprenol N-acetylglucosamine transferase [Polaromonas sp. CG_23.6]
MNPQRCALIMAGGTGGHIFPGLAVAEALRAGGWRVHWLGGKGSAERPSMESQLVPPRGFAFESIDFSGVRGKGLLTLAFLPLRLLKAFWQSVQVIRHVKPDVVVGLGGYIAFPAGMMSVLLGKPLILHEQNSVAGLVNKLLARVADRVFTAFPLVLKNAEWVGNPLRPAFTLQPDPTVRFAQRSGPLKVLVVGGSLGATALNELVPKALALIPAALRPCVTHQSGARQLEALRANYLAAGVGAELTPFINDTAQAFADADLIICRAGASTVTEIAAVGAAALFVPFPSAVDDHQTANAKFLVTQGGGWLVQQHDLTPEKLAIMLQKTERFALVQSALKAKNMQKTDATAHLVAACEELAR